MYYICIIHSTNKKRLTVLDEDEIPTGEVKIFPCLYDGSSRSYRDKSIVGNAWVELAEKLEFSEHGNHNFCKQTVYFIYLKFT